MILIKKIITYLFETFMNPTTLLKKIFNVPKLTCSHNTLTKSVSNDHGIILKAVTVG